MTGIFKAKSIHMKFGFYRRILDISGQWLLKNETILKRFYLYTTVNVSFV